MFLKILLYFVGLAFAVFGIYNGVSFPRNSTVENVVYISSALIGLVISSYAAVSMNRLIKQRPTRKSTDDVEVSEETGNDETKK